VPGAYLTDRPLPTWPWLSRKTGRFEVEHLAAALAGLAERRDDPRVRRYWPGETFDRALRLRAERSLFLDALERLPQSIGHGDFHRGNLGARDRAGDGGTTVAIDWAGVGIMSLGRDLTYLVGGSTAFLFVDADQLPSLDEIVIDNYLQGLREAGWLGDERRVRFAHAGDLGLIGGLQAWGATETSPERRARMEQAWGHPYKELMERNSLVRRYCLDLADEARELLRVM
jgi:hypothetical protein